MVLQTSWQDGRDGDEPKRRDSGRGLRDQYDCHPQECLQDNFTLVPKCQPALYVLGAPPFRRTWRAIKSNFDASVLKLWTHSPRRPFKAIAFRTSTKRRQNRPVAGLLYSRKLLCRTHTLYQLLMKSSDDAPLGGTIPFDVDCDEDFPNFETWTQGSVRGFFIFNSNEQSIKSK